MADRLGGFYPLDIAADGLGRTHFRMRNHVARMRLDLGDDTGPAQVWQAEGYDGELRCGLQYLLHPNLGGVPLPGASAIVLFQGGHRGFGTVIGVEDGRYRGRGYKGGEFHADLIDGADAKGAGGTLRKGLEILLGWVTNLYGKTVNIGTADTTTLTITGTAIKLVGNVEITGSLKVDGATTVQDLAINGIETGGGPG